MKSWELNNSEQSHERLWTTRKNFSSHKELREMCLQMKFNIKCCKVILSFAIHVKFSIENMKLRAKQYLMTHGRKYCTFTKSDKGALKYAIVILLANSFNLNLVLVKIPPLDLWPTRRLLKSTWITLKEYLTWGQLLWLLHSSLYGF